MARYDKATQRIIAKWNAITRKNGKTANALVFHIAVSQRTTNSLHGFFSSTNTGCSHFYVANGGGVEQYVDTARRSSADVAGGDRTISVETAGGLGDDLNKPWSAAQVESLAQIAAWAHKTHGIPLRAMKDSKPSSTGIGFHRLGVPRSRWTSASEPGWLIPGGEVWSTAVGKVCPGDARMAQISAIIARAKAIVTGTAPKPPAGGGGTSKPKPTPVPKPQPGFDTNTLRFQQDLNKYAKAGLYPDGKNGPVTQAWRVWVGDAQSAINNFKSSQPKLLVDRWYGPRMAAYVSDVQRRNKLFVDGQIGPVMVKWMRTKGSKLSNPPKNRP